MTIPLPFPRLCTRTARCRTRRITRARLPTSERALGSDGKLGSNWGVQECNMTKQHYNYGEAVDGGRFTCLRAMPRVRGVLGEDRQQHGEGRVVEQRSLNLGCRAHQVCA